MLAFLTTKGLDASTVQTWVDLDEATRKQTLDSYHEAGIAVMLAVFGAEDKPTTSGISPTEFASTVADYVKKYGFDGADIDYEGESLSDLWGCNSLADNRLRCRGRWQVCCLGDRVPQGAPL